MTALPTVRVWPGAAVGGEVVTPGSYRGRCVRWPAHGCPPWSHLPGRCPLATTAATATSVQPAGVLGVAPRSADRPGDDRPVRPMSAGPARMLRCEGLDSVVASIAAGSLCQAAQPDPERAWPEPPSWDGMHDKNSFAADAGSQAKEAA